MFDLSTTFGMFCQILLAAFLGMLIGAEREHRHKSAGLRTYTLVAVGSALFTILSFSGGAFSDGIGYDPSRIASQVVIGVGFLGAGMIFFKENKVLGLTGAAGIWVTAAVGMTVGLGYYYLAILVTVLVFTILFLLERLKDKLDII